MVEDGSPESEVRGGRKKEKERCGRERKKNLPNGVLKPDCIVCRKILKKIKISVLIPKS